MIIRTIIIILLVVSIQGCRIRLIPDYDKDKDGVADSKDACPDVAGIIGMNGCPDLDGDGIADKDDACPDSAGASQFSGCPDSDGDNIADKNDRCPELEGPAENGGCPWPDSDGDNVFDKDDGCPSVKGSMGNNGCPEISDVQINKLSDYSKALFFKTAKNQLTDASYSILQSVSELLKEYPSAQFVIEGHTDDSGGDAQNQQLSQVRAEVVKNYLIEHGISADRLQAIGYGESRPIADNRTKRGKFMNRRVELRLLGSSSSANAGNYMPIFPIPAPQASDVEKLQRRYFGEGKTLEQVNQKLQSALDFKGYTRKAYFSVNGGFALVTQVEQTKTTGIPVDLPYRWVEEIEFSEEFSPGDIIERLFTAKVGYYRCIVFVVSDQIITFTDSPPTKGTSEYWLRKGATSLPSTIGNKLFNATYNVTALIYQFEKPENDPAKPITTTTIPGRHLVVTGIKNKLSQP